MISGIWKEFGVASFIVPGCASFNPIAYGGIIYHQEWIESMTGMNKNISISILYCKLDLLHYIPSQTSFDGGMYKSPCTYVRLSRKRSSFLTDKSLLMKLILAYNLIILLKKKSDSREIKIVGRGIHFNLTHSSCYIEYYL